MRKFSKARWLAIILGCDAIALTIGFIIFESYFNLDSREIVQAHNDYLLGEENEWYQK